MSNIIEVYPLAGKTARTAPAWQYDYGQILHVNGLELPASYKAEFSNTTRGDAIATVQSTDEITIPAQYLESGAAVYIWLVVVDSDSRTTEYALIVPVAARAKPTDEEPTPAEQSEIDQTLAALNEAVSDVQEIADAIPDTINDALAEAKASGEFDGKDGYTPVKGVDYFDGKDGINGKDGKDGADGYTPQKGIDYFDGEDGKDGKDGQDGQTGPAGKDGKDGSPGADGISPSITVTDITGGHRVTITDADGIHSFDVMDGDSGDAPVQDVQVNGTSIVQDGVANVPVAQMPSGSSIGNFGAIALKLGRGISQNVNDKSLYISYPSNSQVKNGNETFIPVTTAFQHLSAFYGFAKAAGDSTQSASSNAVGTYTDSAKSAISTMLNGPVSVSGTTPSITALPGIQYVCGEVATLDITLPASGCVDVVFESGSTPTVLTVTPPTGMTVEWANSFDSTALEADTLYELNVKMVGTKCLGVAASWT